MMVDNKGIGKVLIIVVLAVVLLLAGLGIMVMGKGHKGGGKAENAPTTEMQLGEFIVNLADSAEIRYLKTNIVLEVEGAAAIGSGEKGGEAGGDPGVRDAVIQVLSSKHFAELVNPKGKEALKKEVVVAVNKRLEKSGTKAVDVYFSEFAMQ
ncbi:MAG: flagellar basal body-associated FliL family protein [Armatimonadetes bacterium]|nr:flagellar basal body-associated FliL family protein [Armatimonadota bacterium]